MLDDYTPLSLLSPLPLDATPLVARYRASRTPHGVTARQSV